MRQNPQRPLPWPCIPWQQKSVCHGLGVDAQGVEKWLSDSQMLWHTTCQAGPAGTRVPRQARPFEVPILAYDLYPEPESLIGLIGLGKAYPCTVRSAKLQYKSHQFSQHPIRVLQKHLAKAEYRLCLRRGVASARLALPKLLTLREIDDIETTIDR